MPLLGKFDTIAGMFRTVTSLYAENTKDAFQRKVNGSYVGVSYSQFAGDVESLALAFRSLGLSRGDRLGIMSENRLEWVLTDFACACTGITDVPIFPILTPDQIAWIFRDAEVRAVVCSNTFQLKKLLKVIDDIPTLNHIIVMQEEAFEEEPMAEEFGVRYFFDLMEEGRQLAQTVPGQLNELIDRVQPDDLLTLIYTSGTTGNPKGVMLTHRNLVANIVGATDAVLVDNTDIVLSYLPLCHAFERMAGYYTCFACGATIAFADSIETVSENLLEIRPTMMTSVPRLFERIKGRVEKGVLKKSKRDQKVFRWAINVGRQHFRVVEKKKKPGFLLKRKYALADKLVFSTIRERTGGRIRFFVSGGAALPRDVGEFFLGIGLKVIEGYGLTESSPVIAANRLEFAKLGTVGLPLPNVEVKIAEDGEILARGESIMQGYYNDPVATAEALDTDGWLHTGDIGEFDEDGYLRITDRKKHLFVSSGGKNIAPGPIEELVGSSALISQIMLVGDDKPYITGLIVPDFEYVKQTLSEQGIPTPDIRSVEGRQQLVESDVVQGLVDADIRRLQRELANYERVRRFELIPEEFSVDNGMMTPTLKIKRKEVLKTYNHLIEQMYTKRREAVKSSE